MNAVNEYGEKQNGFTEVVAFCHVTCRYFDRFLLQGVDRNWRQACFFYLAPGLICEGYWQVNSRRSIFHIADPNLWSSLAGPVVKTFLRPCRLPNRVSTVPVIFQSMMDHILKELPVACYLDDILIQ